MRRILLTAVVVCGLTRISHAELQVTPAGNSAAAIPVDDNNRDRQIIGIESGPTFMAEVRTWANRAGTRRAEGAFMEFDVAKGLVRVRKLNGAAGHVRFADLSAYDQWYVVWREAGLKLNPLAHSARRGVEARVRAFAQFGIHAIVEGIRGLLIRQIVPDGAQELVPPPDGEGEDPVVKGLRAAGQAIVCYVPGRESQARRVCERSGLVVMESYGPGHFLVCRWPQGMAIREAYEALLNDRSVQYVEPNHIITLEPDPAGQQAAAARVATRMRCRIRPNDPRYNELWGMERIRAPQAWCCYRTSSIVVAVSDTGVDHAHQDLAANMWVNPYEKPGDGLDNDGNGVVDDVHGYNAINGSGNAFDDHSHGTHVAGTIGAVGNNRIGVVGVNWRVQIMAVKWIAGNGNGYTSDAIKSIDYAWRNGAKVINASWKVFEPRSQLNALRAAIGRAESAGVVFVAAAGNDGRNTDVDPCFPASFADPNDPDGAPNNLISVAAIDWTDNLASFSNYGRRSVHLAAPGVAILSTLPGNQYGYNSGTSMAAPHVSGAVALVWGQKHYQNLRARQIKGLLLSRADRTPGLAGKCATEAVLSLSWLCPKPPISPCPPAVPCVSYPCSPTYKCYRPWRYSCW